MLVTVFCAPRDRPETTFALDVSPDLELRDFVALCEPESGIPVGEIQITYEEQPLKDLTRALGTYGIKDGDVVVLRQTDRRPPPTQPAFPGLPHIDFRSITVPGTSSSTNHHGATRPQQQAPLVQQPSQHTTQPSTSVAFRGTSPQGLDDPALLQQMLLSNPHELSLLKERNPPLAEALLSGDLERFTKVLLEQQQDRAKREQERIRLLTADPFDLEAQAKIEEDIRQHNVEENMTIAMEEAPESFGQVVMLYINCKVNGHPVKAFVDSGAQMTIMSQACAERCNIMRLVDRRWAGIAKGVGTQKIIGRVHLAQVQIEGDFLPCSFSILEDQPMDMLLGLDMLKRHQCSIDLKKNVLLIGTTGTETRFLSEAELPECARLAYGAEGREDTRPDELADRELAEALQRSIQENHPADGQTTSWQPPPFALPRTLDQMSSSTLPPQSASSGHPQMLENSLSAPATMTQASAPGLCHNQPGVLELPQLSSPGENVDSTPHQPHHLPRVFSPSTEVEVLNTSTSPADVMAQCQDSELEVECAATKGGVPSDKQNTTLLNPEDLSPIQAMEQEVTDTTDATEACPSYLSQSDLFEMELPIASQDVVSSERDQPEREHHSCSNNIPSLAAQVLDHSLSAQVTMTQASAPGLCHNQPRVLELPHLSSPGENACSTPHQPHPLHPVLSLSTEVEVLNTSTCPAEVMTECQDSELEVECAVTKGGVPTDKLNTTLPNPDISPIQTMEQEVTEATDATEGHLSYLCQSESFEMELPVVSHDDVSSERDQPEGEHHSCSNNIPSLAVQMLDHSVSAPATMTQASALRLCHNQPGVPELPHLSSPGENAGSTPHQPHPLHPVLSLSTEVEVLNTSTSPAEVMTECQVSELEVECAATKGGVPSDKLNTTLPNPDISPIQTMEQEVTEATDAIEARPSYLSQSDSFEMELPVVSQDVGSSERDQPEGEHHSCSDNIPSLAAQMLDYSVSAPATMTQASAPRLCHNQPGVSELPHLSSSGENAGSTPHQPHPLHPVLSLSTEVEVLNTSTSPAEVMTECQDSELEVEHAATKGGVPSDKLNTTLSNPEDISPIQTMEQEVTVASDATEAHLRYLSQSDSFEMELPVASQDVVSSERDHSEGEHHSYSHNTPSLAAALTELHKLLLSNNWAQSQNRTNFCSPSHPFKQATVEVPLEPSTPTHNTQNIPSTPITPGVEPSDTKANNVATVSEGPSNCVAPHQSELLDGVSAETVEEETPLQCPDTTEENRAADQDEASKMSICQAEIHPSIPSNCAEHLELRESAEGWQRIGSCSNTADTLDPQAEHTLLIPLPMAEEVSSTTSNSSPPLSEAPHRIDPTLPPSHPFIEHFPAEHIQRIQAAGFSATEAAEALQRAHGVVELALLTLLARSITVPT